MADAALDFLLENMMQLINGSNPLMFLLKKDEMVCLYEEMQFLRKFLMDSVEARTEHKEVRDLVGKIGVLTCEVDDIIDSFILIAFVQREETSKSGIFSLFHRFDYHDKKIHHHVMEEQKLESGSISSRFHLNFSKDLETRYDKVSRIEGIKSFAAERIGDGLGCIMEEIYSIKTKVTEIYEKKKYGIRVLQAPKCSHSSSASPRATSPIIEEETVVGMDDDILAIKEQLFAEAEMRIKLIPIIGMPGLGKTTLARKLYSDPLIVYKFHVRAWTCVSQEYQKRDLLLSILFSAQIIPSHCTEIDGKGDEQLGDMLYKGLKGLKYLIFMDDVWKIHPWNDLKRYLPDDNNGSRVVFTSRHVEVAVHAKPHNLRFLNEKESWDLLQRKVFGKESCPPELIGTGEKIAKKCQGLPLAILTMSGLLLKNDKTLDWWRYVSNNVSSHIISEPEQYMATLELSYNHLPFYLKPCFLYFGAFPEDCEIPVQNLFWLWIAEGFIRKDELKSLEEAAEGYLMDLVERSLVAVSKKKCDGRIKTCRIHDLLRDLCVRKAQKESFFGKISRRL